MKENASLRQQSWTVNRVKWNRRAATLREGGAAADPWPAALQRRDHQGEPTCQAMLLDC